MSVVVVVNRDTLLGGILSGSVIPFFLFTLL